jgi:FkbM family methyltransferase
MKKILIEVGANSGHDTANFLKDFEIVVAFEPHREMYEALHKRFETDISYGRLKLYPYAVSYYTGKSTFYHSNVGDKGTSSLYPYHDKILDTPLQQYDNFTQGFQETYNVPVVRLYDFFSDDEIIDHLHIDAQGSDFDVLIGFGEKLRNVKEGQCECTYNIPIYANDFGNRWLDVKHYLEERDFEVNIAYKHANDSEVDLHFVNRRFK